MERWTRRLAVAATVGMFLVLVMGATVTNTGSAEGCGRHWPLCHGEFIPSYAFETAVEFSHRLVTGIEGFLILGTAIGALLRRRGRRDVKIYVGLMVGTLVLQSGLGASAVLWPQRAPIKATHFGISLVCFASVFLLTRVLRGDPSAEPADLIARQTGAAFLPSWFRWATWGAVVAAIGVAYLGAYMRHSGNEIACHTWPSCNGQIFPGFAGPEGIAFGHRIAALLTGVLVAGLALFAYRGRAAYPGPFRVLGLALVLIVLQALAGGAVVLTRLDLWTTLLHAALMALLFVCLADAGRQVLPQRRAVVAARSVMAPAASGTR